MKRTSANLKTLARESLAGNFSLPVSAYLLITILTSVLSMIVTGFLDVSNTVSLITSQILIYLFSLLSSLLMVGYDKMLLNRTGDSLILLEISFMPFPTIRTVLLW